MHILVEPSDYPSRLLNIGDIAMQRTAVSRIAGFWPGAEINVLTDTPQELPQYASNVKGLSSKGRKLWMSGFLRNSSFPYFVQEREAQIRRQYSRLAEQIAGLRSRYLPSEDATALGSFLETVRDADLLVVCGMGGIADAFERYALDLLDTIGLVKANGKSVVAMFGQAFGPLRHDGRVAARARQILPHVDFIGLRESRASTPLLAGLGVDSSRIMVTGDDALQIAAQDRCSSSGECLGVNVRIASYSQVNVDHVRHLRETLQCFAQRHSIPMLPLPSSLYVDEVDAAFIQSITEGYGNTRPNLVDGPEAMATQLHHCRVAVVCSYHAAVFALAQGVPIIGLYKSDYYRDKFLGLDALFKIGVYPLDLAGENWTENLIKLLDDAWESATILRPQLIVAADEMVEAGRQAYRRVQKMVEQHRSGAWVR